MSGGSLESLPAAARGHLEKLGLRNAFDLVLHLPLRYEDETRITALSEARAGETVQVEAVVESSEIAFRPRRMLLCRTRSVDQPLVLRFFHFYPSQLKQLAPGVRVRAVGEVRPGFFGAEMIHPRYRVVRADTPLPQSLTPIYPTTAGLQQHVLRKAIGEAMAESDLSETLPPELLRALRLPDFAASLRLLHQPPPDIAAQALEHRTHPAWRRIKFDELLAQQLSMRVHQRRRQSARALALAPPARLTRTLVERLPFSLTAAQARCLAEIRADLARAHPMQRLLQGDVGSGKTVVAALAALQAVESGAQVAVMAPTEILAEQHYGKFSAWLQPLGVSVAWLSGSQPRREKREAAARIETGEAQVAVGTHALFQDQVTFHRLALAVVDEQHRFGVHQRLALRQKGTDQAGALQPHQLMMSATPIPRTLAMTFYADLEVSVIDELPPGRTPVLTKLVADARRDEVIARVREACLSGRQAYWVCPLIEESEALQLQTAMDTYESLRTTFPDLSVGLVHGRLSSTDKAAVMARFSAGALQLLVATTVIEVGVDVPNASLMVIEHAERMGLAQMHQLRGRVGRGAAASVCILLFQNPLSDNARERLRIIYEHVDGFEIARHDLRIRGPGELLGARQSGVPMLRFADLEADADLVEAARDAAPLLLQEHAQAAQLHLQRWMGGRQEYLRV